MEFEFDPNKGRRNKTKHGIDLEKAQELWNDPHLLEVEARSTDEPRFLLIGMVDGKHWSAVVTYGEDIIRIITVRRSRKEEVELYEES